MSTSIGYVFLGLALLLNAAANVLTKIGSGQLSDVAATGIWKSLVTNYAFLAGVALFGLNVVFYALALARIPLSTAYPVMVGGGLLAISIVSAVWFRETVAAVQIIGMALILAGVVLITGARAWL